MHSITCEGQTVYPSKIVCIGRNYVEHIEELNNARPDAPVVFIKPNSAITDTLSIAQAEPIHYEGEICFLIKAGAIHAVGMGLDLTKRELQSALKNKGLPWEKAKAFDGSALFSPFVPYAGELADLRMALYINERLVQAGNVGQMLFPPAAIMADIQAFMTLADGDIIMTGTPKGVGQVPPGASFTGQVFSNDKLIIEHCWQVAPRPTAR